MDKEEIYHCWAPSFVVWAKWAKPVLFAHLSEHMPGSFQLPAVADMSWVPRVGGGVAIVLDLPGDEGVWTAIALAEKGYRPVPLYNAIPLPGEMLDLATHSEVAAVNVQPIMSALKAGTERLRQLTIPPDAPPAFMLDANRQAEWREIKTGDFDNRSISFTTDFPSGTFLSSEQITSVLLVQRERVEPRPDLAHTLRRWQDAGLILYRKDVASMQPPVRFEVIRPRWYGTMFQRVLAGLGLRRASVGGFGAWVQDNAGVG